MPQSHTPVSLKAPCHLLDHKVSGNTLVPGVPEEKGSLSMVEDKNRYDGGDVEDEDDAEDEDYKDDDDEDEDDEDEDDENEGDEDEDDEDEDDEEEDDEDEGDRRGVGGGAGRREGGRVAAGHLRHLI